MVLKNRTVSIETLIGKTITDLCGQEIKEELRFNCTDGSSYRMYHDQECCEDVYLDDVCGDLKDLLNTPILSAYKTSRESSSYNEAYEWTFYHLRTIKGTVTLRWYGTSNGYYATDVSFVELVSGTNK